MSARKNSSQFALTHAWIGLRDAGPSQEMGFAFAALATAAGEARLTLMEDSVINSEGLGARLSGDLDEFIVDHLAAGFMPVPTAAASELETLARHLDVPAPDGIEVCHHFHAATDPWGRKAADVELERLAGDRANTALFLRPRGSRGLLLFDPSHGVRMVSYLADGSGEALGSRAFALGEDLVAAELPPLVLDVVAPPDAPTMMADVLSYDKTDVRRRPFSERRALINQIWAELVGSVAADRLVRLTEALPEQSALRATALIDRRAPFGSWRHGR